MNIQDLIPIGVTIAVLAIVLGMSATILGDIRAGQTEGSYEHNITGYGLEGLSELGQWQPTLALIVVAAVIIGIIITAFTFGRR